ncbi:heme-binding protein [Arthrobacter sp. ISL-72]|uniref:GlcG/HbpS family heme-binding protein n=1 Tax=Arthrobacter sp. ISL-72 TaxID=2819114 RepID=UPI001BE6C319|nr:heme-binding protein [Arthrobacter sp. ISL-72]MBT2594211.1 heme-binding protein [Arthrobacter sp. ISL-72]
MKKSNKIAAAAAAGALLLTGGLTAAANAGTSAAPASAAAAAGVSAAVPAVDIQPAPETVVAQNRISVGASTAAVEAALAKCQADKLPFVTVALVDRFGTVQALLRGDNAAEHTIEAAQQKAYTAAAFGAPTSELAKRINGNGPGIDDLPGTLFLAGGVPLKVNGVSVAGIGVGGAPDGALDETCATAGAEAIAAGTAGAGTAQ